MLAITSGRIDFDGQISKLRLSFEKSGKRLRKSGVKSGGMGGVYIYGIETLAHRFDTIRWNNKRALGCPRQISQWVIRRCAELRGS